MSFHYRYRKQIIISILIVCLITTLSLYFISKKTKSSSTKISLSSKKSSSLKKEKIQTTEKIEPEEKKEETLNQFKVDIKGQVINPGLYTVEEGARVEDVINLAGGINEYANTEVINLGKKVFDEMVIIIYSNYEVENFEETKQKEKIIQEACIKQTQDSLKNDACIIDNNINSNINEVIDKKININTATKEELMNLPGIGESKANNIIEYRNKNGNYNSIEDLLKVSGIGENLLAEIKENITT